MDRFEFGVEGVRVGEPPKLLEIADGLAGEFVDLPAVGVGHLTGRRLGVRAQTGGAVDGLQSGHFERIGVHRHGVARDGRAATRQE